MFLETSQNSQESTCVRVSFLIKLPASGLQLFLKETLEQAFYCEFCEISKNTFVTEHLWATASEPQKVVCRCFSKKVFLRLFLKNLQAECLQLYLKKTPTKVFSCEVCEIFKNALFTERLRWMPLQIRLLLLYFFEKVIKQLFRSLVMTY